MRAMTRYVVLVALAVAAIGLASAGVVSMLSPSAQDFGSQPIGGTSAARPFTLTHSCIDDPNPMAPPDLCIFEPPYSPSPNTTGDFVIVSHDCPGVMAPVLATMPSICQINVAFRPTAEGARVGQLRGNATAAPPPAMLSGTGTTMTAAPTPSTPPAGDGTGAKKCKKKKKKGKKGAIAAKKCKKGKKKR